MAGSRGEGQGGHDGHVQLVSSSSVRVVDRAYAIGGICEAAFGGGVYVKQPSVGGGLLLRLPAVHSIYST